VSNYILKKEVTENETTIGVSGRFVAIGGKRYRERAVRLFLGSDKRLLAATNMMDGGPAARHMRNTGPGRAGRARRRSLQ